MAILLQSLCARLGDRHRAATWRRPAATPIRGPVALVLWVLASSPSCATDLAEVIGTAIGLNLLFGIPLELGVIITALDVFLVLYLQNLGFRWIEALDHHAARHHRGLLRHRRSSWRGPSWAACSRGFVPSPEIVTNPDMLYLALGILGATVMPHNLYLHSAIVQTRAYGETHAGEARGDQASPPSIRPSR